MRSPREAAASGICANSLQPQCSQRLRGTWAPLLWNVKSGVTSLVADPWKYFWLDLLNINDKKSSARGPLLQKYVPLFEQCTALMAKTKGIFLLGPYLAERGIPEVLGKRLCEPLFFQVYMEAYYTVGVRMKGN